MSGIPYCVLLFRVDGALLAILALALELDVAVNQSKQGVVAADTDIDARMDVRASLANQNVAREDELTVRALHARNHGRSWWNRRPSYERRTENRFSAFVTPP